MSDAYPVMSGQPDQSQSSLPSPWRPAEMKVTMLLADAAQVVGGKLYVLGGGWSVMGPEATPVSIAMKFEVPWHQAEQNHEWDLHLIDSDGQPVLCTEHGNHPVRYVGRFHVHRPPDLEPGVPIDFALVVNAGLVAIPSGRRYLWRLAVDCSSAESWQLAFSTRPAER